MNVCKVDKVILRISGCLFIAGGITHWLIIFGILSEKAPVFLTMYFHSLAVLSTAAGAGLWLLKDWGLKVALFICVTQIPAHLYMIYLDVFGNWNSGYGIAWRVVDLGLVVGFTTYALCRKPLLP